MLGPGDDLIASLDELRERAVKAWCIVAFDTETGAVVDVSGTWSGSAEAFAAAVERERQDEEADGAGVKVARYEVTPFFSLQ